MIEKEIEKNVMNIELNESIMNEEIKRIQEQLLQMGFDLIMINKVIQHFNVTTIEEGLLLLIKTDGIWGHPFISEAKEQEGDNRSIIREAVIMARNKANAEKCEICGELKSMHNENQLHNLGISVRKHLSSENNEVECNICMCPLEDPINIQPCNHQFCSNCFTEYLKEKITNNKIETIKCPSADCDSILNEVFILGHIPSEFQSKYQTFKERNKLMKKSNIVFCPSCESYAENPQKDKKCDLVCSNNHTFCNCGRPKHDEQCYKPGKELKEYIQGEKIKKCPKCGFLIKKDKGCNHIICGNPTCNFEFCWLCLEEYKGDHYEIGKCKDMQYVDENSLRYKLRAHPCLIKVYNFLMAILVILALILAFVVIVAFPCLPAICFSFYLIFVEVYFYPTSIL